MICYEFFRKDIRIDSPSREEDVARVLARLGINTLKYQVLEFRSNA